MNHIKIKDTAEGGGKYGDVCEKAFHECEAEGIILLVINGNKGNGFSAIMSQEMVLEVPEMLRHMAEDIEHLREVVKQS